VGIFEVELKGFNLLCKMWDELMVNVDVCYVCVYDEKYVYDVEEVVFYKGYGMGIIYGMS